MNQKWMMADQAFAEAWDSCAEYTMTSPERGYALWRAVEHIAQDARPGAFVECGCWRGGSAMLMKFAAQHFGIGDRPLFLFDTFAGMTEPQEVDLDLQDRPAAQLLNEARQDRESAAVWAFATLDEVKENFETLGLDTSTVNFVKGDVIHSLPATRTGIIALLRLDTDFYESTKAELEHLYPRLCPGGILLIDDYGHWKGAKLAVDEFFDPSNFQSRRPLLNAVDYTGRIGVKPSGAPGRGAPRYDYMPPGYADPNLISAFPSLVVASPQKVNWPWLRKNSPHIWRTDNRSKRPMIGVLSYEEALILYNVCKPFAGKRGLEIGCHFGWSTAHLVAAGLHLDVVDPALHDDVQCRSVRGNIEHVMELTEARSVEFYPAFSPGIIPAVAAIAQESWSVAFIDGLHDGEGPLNDAKAVLPFMSEDAVVLLHDLLCPDVFSALQFLRNENWNVQVLNTSQVMGLAWRGNVSIPEYMPDPNVPLPTVEHLQGQLKN